MKKMKSIVLLFVAIIGFNCSNAIAQNSSDGSDVSNEVLLELYRGARVADVVDGLATVGYTGIGVMKGEIAPLWRDVKTMKHRISGIAFTVRYGPTNRPLYPGADLTKPENYDVYREWRGNWYGEISPEGWMDDLEQGNIIVMDNKDDNDTGTTGSNNILAWKQNGAVGLVASGGVRDLDEIILQENPVYMNYEERGRGERIGRNELMDVQEPVVVGGVLVEPGDVVVADVDGVVVVPRRVAVRVGQIAYQELIADMRGRRAHYEKLGREIDETVANRPSPEEFFRSLGLPVDPNKLN